LTGLCGTVAVAEPPDRCGSLVEFVVLGLLGLAFIFAGPVAFFLVLDTRRRLLRIEQRLAFLQAQGAGPIGLPGAAPIVATPPAPAASEDIREDVATQATEPPPPSEPPPGTAPQTARWPSRPPKNVEEQLGTRWAVWVGGIALALGGLLLVRYTIEQGFLGPGARVIAGLIFGVLIIIAGEALRRRERTAAAQAEIAGLALPAITNVPAILVSAGTVAAFGAVYAAHGLYHFIGPAVAFMALGAIGFFAMLVAALHGPMLAGVGLIGALAAPLLVQSPAPSAWPAVLYLAITAAAAYALSRFRDWLWLALATSVGVALWAVLLSISANSLVVLHAAFAHLVVQSLLVVAVYIVGLRRLDAPGLDKTATIMCAGFAALGLFVLATNAYHFFNLSWPFTAIALIAVFAFAGARYRSANGLTLVATIAAAFLLIVWPADTALLRYWRDFALGLPRDAETFAEFAALAAAIVALPAGRRLYSARNLPALNTLILAAASTVTPLVILILAYLRLAPGEVSARFAAIDGFLALAFLLLTQAFLARSRNEADTSAHLSAGAMATATLAALALGFFFLLDRGLLTMALALCALGAAFVSVRLSIPALRYAVLALGFIIAARLIYDPRISADIGPTPILNWLLLGYGTPALAFGIAARIMRRTGGEDLAVRVAQGLAIVFSALLCFFEIRHLVHGGDPFARIFGLLEIGLFATTALSFSIVLTRLNQTRAAPVFNAAALIASGVSILIIVIGLAGRYNPLFTGEEIEGGALLNTLLLAYALPAILAALLAHFARGVRPAEYITAATALAFGLFFAYVTLEVRRLFQGPSIAATRTTSAAELYTYSAVWVVIGIALLFAGLLRGSRQLRLASAAFIVMAVVKIFLWDLAGLEGLLRALSFIGLGLVLLGIGLVYQKWVFPRRATQLPQN
jgi:uncharacterized membrane protein